jgi:hypothetical protein
MPINQRHGGQPCNFASMAVAAVIFSNGGDNIGVYTPLFAKYNSAITVIWVVIIFMAMTAIWCIAAYYLVNHPLVASKCVTLATSFYLLSSLGSVYTFWLNLLFPFSDNYYVAIDYNKLIPDLRMLSCMSRLKNGKKNDN